MEREQPTSFTLAVIVQFRMNKAALLCIEGNSKMIILLLMVSVPFSQRFLAVSYPS